MIRRVTPRARVSALAVGVALSVGACSGGTTVSSPPSTTTAADCEPGAPGRLLSSSTDRILTEARLIHLERDGQSTDATITGLPGPIVPSILPAGSRVDPTVLAGLLPGVPDDYGTEPSPRLDPSGWRGPVGELGGPADVIWFAGIDRVDTEIDVACGRPDGEPLRFSTWTAPALGLLECGTEPPPESTAALAQRFCPA